LKQVFVGGEILLAEMVRQFYQCFPQAKLHNLYGPTETTIDTTIFHCMPEKTYAFIPIGRPIDNVSVYVLDSCQQPVPMTVTGELYIGGVGLARGYLNQPELTQERFINNPFGEGRLYKTGDLVRWLPDGNLEFIGRVDNQIKIRGVRIEPGEIETHLLKHPAVQQCAVIVKGSDVDKQLVAYIVLSQAVSANEWRSFLKKRLPDYMIPSLFFVLEELPKNSSGKIDRQALQQSATKQIRGEATFVAPRNTIEKSLSAIWSELLNIQRISIHDNFFSLGGHSLLASQLALRIQETFKIKLCVAAIFEAQTIAALSSLIQGIIKCCI
jgi:acyl-coenzyme A synthetase/AMP-(fatty) acid ligase/acyl carrier protein